jgi:methylase of polypeptide subunit release factors
MKPQGPVSRFYDELAADYHLVYADWDASIVRQGESLDRLIYARRASVLDCACGIGTQAIGLALRGHRVTGSDISPAAVGRVTREAERRGVPRAPRKR